MKIEASVVVSSMARVVCPNGLLLFHDSPNGRGPRVCPNGRGPRGMSQRPGPEGKSIMISITIPIKDRVPLPSPSTSTTLLPPPPTVTIVMLLEINKASRVAHPRDVSHSEADGRTRLRLQCSLGAYAIPPLVGQNSFYKNERRGAKAILSRLAPE